MINKAYIITTPCSGKSTFINSHESEYKILHIIDHDFFGSMYDFRALETLPEYSCILGRNLKPDQEKYIYAVVLLDENLLRKQIVKRKIQDP